MLGVVELDASASDGATLRPTVAAVGVRDGVLDGVQGDGVEAAERACEPTRGDLMARNCASISRMALRSRFLRASMYASCSFMGCMSG